MGDQIADKVSQNIAELNSSNGENGNVATNEQSSPEQLRRVLSANVIGLYNAVLTPNEENFSENLSQIDKNLDVILKYNGNMLDLFIEPHEIHEEMSATQEASFNAVNKMAIMLNFYRKDEKDFESFITSYYQGQRRDKTIYITDENRKDYLKSIALGCILGEIESLEGIERPSDFTYILKQKGIKDNIILSMAYNKKANLEGTGLSAVSPEYKISKNTFLYHLVNNFVENLRPNYEIASENARRVLSQNPFLRLKLYKKSIETNIETMNETAGVPDRLINSLEDIKKKRR